MASVDATCTQPVHTIQAVELPDAELVHGLVANGGTTACECPETTFRATTNRDKVTCPACTIMMLELVDGPDDADTPIIREAT